MDTGCRLSLSITGSTDGRVEFVRLNGVVEIADARVLGPAAEALIEADPRAIYVDLGGVTVTSRSLVAFLRQLGNDHARRSVILCRPTAMVRSMIRTSGLGEIVRVRADLPAGWPMGGSDLDLHDWRARYRPAAQRVMAGGGEVIELTGPSFAVPYRAGANGA